MFEVTEQFPELTPWEGLKTGYRILCVFAVDSLLSNTQSFPHFPFTYTYIDQGGVFLLDGHILVFASFSMGSLLFSPFVGKRMKEQAAANIISISVVIARYLKLGPAPDAWSSQIRELAKGLTKQKVLALELGIPFVLPSERGGLDLSLSLSLSLSFSLSLL